MGVGVNPEPDFKHDLPCAGKRSGIKADESLGAADSVWVAGDIANMNGLRIEHWRSAQQQGMRAALGMLDLPPIATGVPFFWTYHFGKRIGYLGHAEQWDHILTRGQFKESGFMAFYLENGLIRAVLSCEAETETALLAELMREPLTVDSARRQLKIELQRQL